jgi:preprotein translocase subunit SecD
MQKNLLFKTLLIIAVLLIFLFGIFGIPSGFSGDALKQAVLDHIHLGLDLKGGTHLILQVMVNEAVAADSDHAIETLKAQLAKSNITFGNISKPDPDNHPERIVIENLDLNAARSLPDIVRNNLPDYDLTNGPNNTWVVTMRPSAISDLKTRTVDKSIEAIRRRVDGLGVSEPVIQRNGMGNDEILVQLPGVDDPGRVKEIIQSTARLELREARGGPYRNETEALQANGGRIPPNMVLLHGTAPGGGGDVVYVVSRVPVVSGTDIRDARAGHKGDTNQPIVNFYLTASAGKKFADFTELHRKDGADPSNLAIVLDNRVFSAPGIESQIFDTGYIEGGDFLGPKGEERANDLAKLLQSGALPASLRYLTERTVGPSLGADSIRSGVKAAIWGMLAVMVFMLIYYRAAGINADVALIFNLIILLGFLGWMNMFKMSAVLTLPGIAGVILTVGMGVDSNVLIFERIREELRNGKAPAAAVDQGFSRAWTTILDTHVTTIVSALILIFVGSGPVSGFGLTLAFGLVANLFTAVFVSRVIFDAVLSRKERGAALSI